MVGRGGTFYRYGGVREEKVEARERLSPDQRKASGGFEIEAGLRVLIREAEFHGIQPISTAELQQVVADTVRAKAPVPVGEIHPTDDPLELEGRTPSSARASEPDPDPRTVFVDGAYQEAAESLTQLYRSRGFLSARVGLASFESDLNGPAGVRVDVTEGVHTYVLENAFARFTPGILPNADSIKVEQHLR